MQSEHADTTVYRNLRTTAENHTDLRAVQYAKPDTRRFASIFSLEVPKAVAVGCNDTAREVPNDDSDDSSRWQLISRIDNNPSVAQVSSVASVDERSTRTEAQQIIACYRAIHSSDPTPECTSTEINENLAIPDDKRSMYTISTSVDTQSTMDMMWRPKPKVHMRYTDQMALIQAQTQAVEMMHNAGLQPTSKIQCRRRGCADILPGVEALKYHLHIHNIAETAARCNHVSLSPGEPSLVHHSNPDSNVVKRNHSRSKSSLGTKHKGSMTYLRSRKLSAGSLLPSHPSPREIPEVRHNVPSLTTIASSIVSDLSQSKSPNPLAVRNDNEVSSAHISTPSRGRRARKGSMAASEGVDAPSIAMLLSPPSLPGVYDRLKLTPPTNSPTLLDRAVECEDKNRAVTPSENAHKVCENFTQSRSLTRALSPTRAMSPIRNGIRRVLSIGYSGNSKE